MEKVYAIFDDFNICVYLCYEAGEDEYDQFETMSDDDWEEWLNNEICVDNFYN